MSLVASVFLPAGLGFGLGAAVIAVLGRGHRRRLQGALQEARATQDSLRRVIRLVGRDLRDTALRLTGLASLPETGAAPAEHAARLALAARRCRLSADDLGTAGSPPPGIATLREERIDLVACARDAVAAIAATIAPGRRCFLLPPPAAAAWVWADPRATRQVLGRVIAEATFNTGQDDAISLAVSHEAGALVLAVADEGSGVAGSDPADEDRAAALEFRGLIGTLALPRALMEAHGGSLDIVSAPGAGTRVSLVFPPERRRG